MLQLYIQTELFDTLSPKSGMSGLKFYQTAFIQLLEANIFPTYQSRKHITSIFVYSNEIIVR